MDVRDAEALRNAPLLTPSDLKPNVVKDTSGALNILLADLFAGDQIFATTDAIAERVRKIGGTTLRSIGRIARLQRVSDNDADFVTPLDTLAELREDNKQLAANLRESHGLCDEHGDVATTSLLENWIDQADERTEATVRSNVPVEEDDQCKTKFVNRPESKKSCMPSVNSRFSASGTKSGSQSVFPSAITACHLLRGKAGSISLRRNS